MIFFSYCYYDNVLKIGTTTPNRNRCFNITTPSEWSHPNHDTSTNNNNDENYFYCMTCPYTCPVASQQQKQQSSSSSKNSKGTRTTTTTILQKKKRMTVVTDLSSLNQYGKRRMMGNQNAAATADLDILGGKSAWDNVDRTTIFCSKCSQQVLAYFVQIQIRSADEPMTIFYKCSTCSFQWNE